MKIQFRLARLDPCGFIIAQMKGRALDAEILTKLGGHGRPPEEEYYMYRTYSALL